MFKLIFLILLLILSGCSQQIIVNPEDELTFEKKFEWEIKKCDLLKIKNEVKDCKDNILLQQAISLDDNSYCDYSSSIKAKELCNSLFYLDKAEKENNNVFCGFITHETIKEICLKG